MPKQHCTVSILRPYATSHEAFIHDVDPDAEEYHHDDRLDESVDDIVDALHETSRACSVLLTVNEVELRRLVSDGGDPDDYPIMSMKRSKDVRTSDVIVTIDPPSEVVAFVAECVQNHPSIRAVLALSKQERLENLIPVFRVGCVPLLGTTKYLRRMYAAIYKQPDTLSRSFTEAFLFPNGTQYPLAACQNRVIQEIPDRYIEEFGS